MTDLRNRCGHIGSQASGKEVCEVSESADNNDFNIRVS
jgi:hypothetical protein